MNSACLYKIYISVDSAARIPTAVWLVAIINLYENDVISIEINQTRKFVLERNISVRTPSYLLSVEVDGRIHVSTVEMNVDAFSGIFLVNLEVLAIPAHSAGKSTSARTRKIFLAEISFDSPIVRKI